MLSSIFVEDIFLKFYQLAEFGKLPIQPQDYSAIISFYNVINDNKELTQNQANYILKILQKYKIYSLQHGLDYQTEIDNPVWKNKFRVLDLSKKVFVEKDEDNQIWVCLKFPYQLKKQFEDEVDIDKSNSLWEDERKIRKISIYNINMIQLYEFLMSNGFEIDETFMIALGEVEEIWQNSESLVPKSEVVNGTVELKNTADGVLDYFNLNRKVNFYEDAFLAKSMGYPLDVVPSNAFEKLVSSNTNSFWIKDNQTLFDFYKKINGKICIILDRTSNRLAWLQKFISDADISGISRQEIKVCFRENKDSKTGLNDWVKLAGVGGKIEEGKILIFEFKPAKWLFKEQENVKMLVSNNLYPSTNSTTRDWLSVHPCVVYLGDIKPSEQKGQKIVEL